MSMNTPVDVLAVMDAEIDAFRKTEAMVGVAIPERRAAYAEHLAKLIDARAVVVELIESSREVERWWLEEGMHKFEGAPACIFNLRAAIAKAKGETA